jgi:hypothetical protein
VQLRHFVVDAKFDRDINEFTLHFSLKSSHPLEVDLATLLEANTMAERVADRELRYHVLQHELRIILSYVGDGGSDDQLRLDVENFAATAGHIKRFVSESVGLGMLTAAVQEVFAWKSSPDAILNFDVLPGEFKDQFGKGGVRPDLLFGFKDERALAGEARGRSQTGPLGVFIREEQRQRMKDMLRWSRDHGDYPVTMTWAYLGGDHVQVDLFTMSDGSVGSLEYMPQYENVADIDVGIRQQFTADATGRGERRAARLFETAPPARESRRLFDREVRGDWVTADLVRPSNIRLFLGAMETPIPPGDLRSARSRGRRTSQRPADMTETALSDRLLIVVARSEDPEPAWSRIEAFIERGESDA